MKNLEKQIEEIKKLGFNIEVVGKKLKLIGDWNEKLNPYNGLFVEITGGLDTSYIIRSKDFLRNLKTIGDLYTSNIKQDDEFLKNVTINNILKRQ